MLQIFCSGPNILISNTNAIAVLLRSSVDCNRFGMGQIWYWLWREALCTGANTDEGCGTRPLNNTHAYTHTQRHSYTHIHSPRLTKSCKLHYMIMIQWERECEGEWGKTENERNRQKCEKKEFKKMCTESLWMHVVSDRGMMVLGKHHGAFLCVHMAWVGAHTVPLICPPPLLSSFTFLPMGVSPELPLFCRHILLQFIRPLGFCCSSFTN